MKLELIIAPKSALLGFPVATDGKAMALPVESPEQIVNTREFFTQENESAGKAIGAAAISELAEFAFRILGKKTLNAPMEVIGYSHSIHSGRKLIRESFTTGIVVGMIFPNQASGAYEAAIAHGTRVSPIAVLCADGVPPLMSKLFAHNIGDKRISGSQGEDARIYEEIRREK